MIIVDNLYQQIMFLQQNQTKKNSSQDKAKKLKENILKLDPM